VSAHLNPNHPYGEVYGVPGVRFQQNGRYFRSDGTLLDGDPDRDREVRQIEEKLSDPETAPEAAELLRARKEAIGAAVVAAPAAPPAGEQSDEALKAILGTYGEAWSGRKAALRFLERGHG
jgi:hypothetical protein